VIAVGIYVLYSMDAQITAQSDQIVKMKAQMAAQSDQIVNHIILINANLSAQSDRLSYWIAPSSKEETIMQHKTVRMQAGTSLVSRET